MQSYARRATHFLYLSTMNWFDGAVDIPPLDLPAMESADSISYKETRIKLVPMKNYTALP